MGDEDLSVKVAVRVRPFNSREIERGARCIIKMNGNTTWITDPADESQKSFAYDYSYWSFDNTDPNYASQQTLFQDCGTQVIGNAWNGYNCSIFAYGQTGSGKSYSMLGYGEDKGIIPLICENLFERIGASKVDDDRFLCKVEVSFMEIYNEKVKDLLNPKNKGTLKVRNHPTIGPYVEDLSKIAVNSFAEIDMLMDEGSKARTVASTNMNATSSRSHAVFTIEFTHGIEGEDGSGKTSKINLVDLAGSERADSTGATGARLKEGANINKSLSSLAKVISSLALISVGGANAKKQAAHVPYRDSVLTWLLKESLGGNAKTIMIAAISPADINHSETLSTLRYADNAKKIKNKAVINEDAQTKLVRDLKAEVEALRAALIDRGVDPVSITSKSGITISDPVTSSPRPAPAQVMKLQEELESREKLIVEMNKTWEERLKEAQTIQQERKAALEDMGVAIQAVAALPHFVNLNEDPLMSGSLLYYLKEGTTRVGRSDAEVPQDIVLNGLNIAKEHTVIELQDGIVTVFPKDGAVFINGNRIFEPTKLDHGSRVVMGHNHVFRFNHPEEAAQAAKENATSEGKKDVVDWDFAIRELAVAQYNSQTGGKSKTKEGKFVQEFVRSLYPNGSGSKNRVPLPTDAVELVRLVFRTWQDNVEKKKLKKRTRQVMLLINEANAISEALQKKVLFELKLWSSLERKTSDSQPSNRNKTEVGVQITNTLTKATAVWTAENFEHQVFDMREAYQNFLESGTIDTKMESNPFEIRSEQEIGLAHLYLKNLRYLFDINRKVPILSLGGEAIGELHVEILPQVANFTKGLEKVTPDSILGRPMKVTVRVIRALNMPVMKYTDLFVRFSFWDVPGETQRCADDTLFQFEKVFVVDRVTEEFLSYVETGSIAFEIWGNIYQQPEVEDVDKELKKDIDIKASINLLEFDKGQFLMVPIKEDARRANSMSHDPTSIFMIRKGRRRRIILTLVYDHNFGSLECPSVTISGIRLKSGGAQFDFPKKNSGSLKASTSMGNLLAHGDAKDEPVPLKVISVSGSQITVQWDPADHPSPLLSEKTLKNYRVSMKASFNLKFSELSKTATISIPVFFKVLDSEIEFKESANLLEHFKGLLLSPTPSTTGSQVTSPISSPMRQISAPNSPSPRQTAPEDQLSGALFSLRINSGTDDAEPNAIVATILDEHQERLAKLENALELEKLKQDLEFFQKIQPEDTQKEGEQDVTKGIEEQIDNLKKEEQMLQHQTRRRGTTLTPIKSIEVEVLKSPGHRNVQMQGYLNKKSAIKNRWKKFWFVLARPYLYYYPNKDMSTGEKTIDIADCAITSVNDPENPYSFAIVTWKRLWVLQALGSEEKDQWMLSIDPSYNAIELKRRALLAEQELEEKDREISNLTSRLSESDDELRQKVATLQTFCSSLTKKMEILKRQMVIEKEEGKRKDDEISLFRQLSESLQSQDSEKVVQLKREIENLRPAYLKKMEEGYELSSEIGQLKADLTEIQLESQTSSDVAKMWEDANFKMKTKFDLQSVLLENVSSQSMVDKSQVELLKEELKLVETELMEKDYQAELLGDKTRNIEDESRVLQLQVEQLNGKLKLKQEELETKDELLSEKFTVKIPADEGGFRKLFGGNSRADFLEKQLIASKKAALAHQTHNAFLNMEITRYEKEMKIQLKLREQSIDRLKKEMTTLRKRLYHVSKEKGERMVYNMGAETDEDIREHFQVLKRKYFANCVIVGKMNLTAMGMTCNLSVSQLLDEANQENVTDYEDYPDWINTKMTDSAVPIPNFDSGAFRARRNSRTNSILFPQGTRLNVT
eukprot:TRINITY_DN2369_c0_g1_i1.p1 TRINITY_DN2369_c0_g1~~TRINITY_DN2369_c0_g1_i1.p1  ORF type:complete len:1807 (+),score=664.88 TRINITY_DN2369_c0_g1_i1:153-5573(+)